MLSTKMIIVIFVAFKNDIAFDIYFISQGSVKVSMVDTQNQAYPNLRTLQTGDHFGEISMIYGCPRTATVTCNDYCTFAVLL